MSKIANVITSVKVDSIADELGIECGDILISINNQAIMDIIDYKYLISDEYIELLIKKQNGEEWVLEIEKEFDGDLGIDFENPLIDKAKSCANRCIFCFIDQLPKGMRQTLYFKDDDSRLSFLHGNFITLSNMTDDDIERIIKYRIGPLNVSVHTTDPELRIKMLGNKKAGNILERLKKLTSSGIDINCQIVLCRGINDENNLKKTITDLASMYPEIKNVAVVPVGISKYREKLYPLIPYDEKSSKNVLNLIKEMQDKLLDSTGTVFVRAADEFYIMAGYELPDPDFYGIYEQLEDGIGMMTFFIENTCSSLQNITMKKKDKKMSVVTGVSAYKYVKDVCQNIESMIQGIKINVYAVKNTYFGENITVAGLLTGVDIISELHDKDLGTVLFMPSNILKNGERVLLDDMSVEALELKLGVNIKICSFDGSDFVKNIIE